MDTSLTYKTSEVTMTRKVSKSEKKNNVIDKQVLISFIPEGNRERVRITQHSTTTTINDTMTHSFLPLRNTHTVTIETIHVILIHTWTW